MKRNYKFSLVDTTVLRNFSSSDDPLEIFDSYIADGEDRLRACRRWFGQAPDKLGDWQHSRVVFRGQEVDYGEDPRVFRHQGKICILAANYSREHGFRNHLVVFNDDTSWNRYFLMPPLGLPPGKNWTPLELLDGRLAFIHSFSPLRMLIEISRERGIILLGLESAPGVQEESVNGDEFPAHRGGTNGITMQDTVIGFGHTTRKAKNNLGDNIISPNSYYPNDEQIIHRPFFWDLDLEDLSLRCHEIDLPWHSSFWIIDPTSLIYDKHNAILELFTTEVERNFVDPASKGRTVRYRLEIE